MNTPPQPPPYGQQPPPYGQQPSYGQQPPPYGQQQMYGPPPGYAPPPPPTSSGSQWGPSSIGMEPNVSAGLGYLISILAIVFFFMEKQNRFVRFHTAQAMLLSISYLVLFALWFVAFFAVVIGSAANTTGDTTTTNTVAGLGLILLSICIGVVALAYMVSWIWGMIAAFSGRMVKFPLVGAIAERWAGGPVVPVVPVAPVAPFAPPPPPPAY